MDLEREAAAARAAAAAAAEAIARFAGAPRESYEKAADSPVTQADLAANRAIESVLHDAFPEDPILSEETRDSPRRLHAERVWIVDPLDGTKEWIEGIPEFAVSIALVVRGEPAVGVVLQPTTRECFFGAAGEGAWLGERRLRVSGATRLEECRALASRTEMSRGQLERQLGWFREVVPVGSVALKLALVAASRADFWLSAAPKSEWDVCAGDLLLREAGGVFATLDRGTRVYNRPDVLLSPPMAAGPAVLVSAWAERSRRC
jgi:myo-inositol-1(or 4)-monophosphatase